MSVDSAMLVDSVLTVEIALSVDNLPNVMKDNPVAAVDAVLALEQV